MSVTKARSARLFRAALRMGVCAALIAGCSKPKAKPAEASPSESAPAPVVADSVPVTPSVARGPLAHTPVPRDSIKPPPLTAPPEAASGPGGVRYQVLKAGTGDTPGPVDTIVVNFNMWTGDGKLALSSYTEPEAAPFSVSAISPQFRSLLSAIHQGSTVRYWIPRAALAGWKPENWPDADLIIEFEMLSVSHATQRDGAGNAIEALPSQPPPDAAGPPSAATATASGLHYIYLIRGTSTKHPTSDAHLNLVLDAYAIDGLTVQALAHGMKTATTLARAPGNLSEVLAHLVTGDQVRVWLPMGVGRQVIPSAGSHDVVLDMWLTF
jgi:hypothetical protein